jgi:hypothetical protein
MMVLYGTRETLNARPQASGTGPLKGTSRCLPPFPCPFEFFYILHCHNSILGYSLKFTFFQNKNQKNKIKAGNVEKAS